MQSIDLSVEALGGMMQTGSAEEFTGKACAHQRLDEDRRGNEGGGKMWVGGTKIEPAGADVASTNMAINRAKSPPKTPVNLSFDPNHPK